MGLTEIAVAAGRTIMAHRKSSEPARVKSAGEIVTPADIESNELIVRSLRERWPDIPIYSEEGDDNKSEAQRRWIVDPLDGTTPWVWGNSGFAVSLALEVDGDLVVALVYDPVMEELFYAERHGGATRNGEPIAVSNEDALEESLLVVDWGNSDASRREGLSYFHRFLLPEMSARRVVPQFAPALGLCRIAEGRIHGLVCNDTQVEDHAAASLILTEAGGFISDFGGRTAFSHRSPGAIAACSRRLHGRLVELVHTTEA